MGGGISYGNVTSTAEFNIYVDPEAARIVFESGIPIIMSGLDVTDKAAIFEDEILALKERGPVSTMVGELLDFYSIYGKKWAMSAVRCMIHVLLPGCCIRNYLNLSIYM